jgi:DNA invertase Pin-like site-specific DNA recombinase
LGRVHRPFRGSGHRRIAAGLGVPAATARGWLRRAAQRLEQMRVWFITVAVSAGVDVRIPDSSGCAWREAMAACREGDTLLVTKLDRLARSLPDARAIAEELTTRQVRLSLGASVYDPNDPVGRLLFNVLAMVAEFESDLIRLRTREGMKVAKAKGRLRGKQPKLNPRQEAHLVGLLQAGEHSTGELADLFGVARSTLYRAQQRHQAAARP